jgi:SAM-dependent methyltransferase
LSEPIDPEWLGLADAVAAGWFNINARELAPGFALEPSDVLVDVGSGDGGVAAFCARLAGEVVLVDHDEPRLDRAIERVRQVNGAATSGRVGDIASLPLPDGFASRVLCMEVLEHVDHPVAAMAELWRIGRPGARYLISVPGAGCEHLQKRLGTPNYFEKPHHIRIFEADELLNLVAGAGLTIERRIDHAFYWTIWWTLFWQSGAPFSGGFRNVDNPVLDAWNRTWSLLLASPDGLRVKQALDEFAPRSVAVVARKP